MPAPIALIELVDQACRIGSASHMIRQALQVADEDDSVDWGAACAALIARVSRGSLPAGGSKEEEERDDERSRWYALVLCETLFIHHRPFRVGSLSRLRDLAAAALSDSTCVRERCLVTFRRWMARFPGEWRLQILPLYVRNAFHLEIPEDPSVARREAVSDGLASMEEVFLAKTSRLSDAVQELQTCFEIVIPDIGMNPASSGVFVMASSMGRAFRQAVRQHAPLQIIGCTTAYTGMLAQRAGAKALYVSGSGVATASHGLPDLGITNLNDVVEDVRRLSSCTTLPILVDVDTGFGSAFGIARTVNELERAGAAAIHIEDQEANKRCGHRPNKTIVDVDEMCDRIRAAVDARSDPDFVIMARTDALANEGLDGAVKRAQAYIDAGADMLFPEAFTKLEQYAVLQKHFPDTPYLANITEFGATPLFSTKDLGNVGVSMVLYPLSIHRAQASAAIKVAESIINQGHQKNVVDMMQTRDELYEALDYRRYEDYIDSLSARRKPSEK